MWQAPFRPHDEAERQRRIEDEEFGDAAYWRWVFAGGLVALAAFVVFAAKGVPGAGVILVPIGLGMAIFGGLQALLYR